MNGPSFEDRWQQRLTAFAAIVAVHVGLFLVLTAARPVIQAFTVAPIEVGFIAQELRAPERWVPPAPEVVPVTVVTTLPQAITVETPPVAAESAITLAPRLAVTAPPASSGGDTPMLLSAVEYVRPPVPHYPQASRRQREQGVVILRVLIDPSGQAARIEVHRSSGFSRLDEAAREAVQRAAFKPHVEGGIVQAAFVLIPIEFSLNVQHARRS